MRPISDLNISTLNNFDLQRVMARGRAIRSAESRVAMSRAIKLIRRWWA